MSNPALKDNNITIEQLLASAEKIGKLAEQEAQEAEKNATISENVVNLIKETQISRLLLPKKYGGPQIDFDTFAKIIRKVAYYNVSAAWLTYFYPLHNTLPSFLSQKGMDEIANDGGLICDVFAPVGKAVRDGDGYRISWPHDGVRRGWGARVLYANHENIRSGSFKKLGCFRFKRFWKQHSYCRQCVCACPSNLTY